MLISLLGFLKFQVFQVTDAATLMYSPRECRAVFRPHIKQTRAVSTEEYICDYHVANNNWNSKIGLKHKNSF